MSDDKRRVIWVVTPHESGDYDEWWGPGETEEDHQAAFAYAYARLEDAWDQGGPDEQPATVTIGQRWVDEEDFKLTQEGGDE